MGYNIPEKIFDQHMHIVRDVHFDVDKYKVNELYVIKHTITNAHTIDGKMVGKLIKAEVDSLIFDIFTEVIPEGVSPTDPHNYYSIKTITLFIDDIIEKKIEIERLMTESEADFRTANTLSVKVEPEEPSVFADKYKDVVSLYTPLFTTPNPSPFDQIILSSKSRLKSDIQAAYKINTPEEAAEIAKDSQMNIVNDIMEAAEEEKKNYVVSITNSLSGLSKSFSILDSEGNFDPEPFKGLTTGSGRVRVKLIKGNSTVQFNVHSKYIKVASDVIIITGNKNKSSICMTLMRDNFREMFDKIEFEQIL